LTASPWTIGSKLKARFSERRNGRPKQREGLSVDSDQAFAHGDLGVSSREHFGLARRSSVSSIPLGCNLTVIVLLECGVLAVNGGRCPLSDLAARFTADRNSNFDIYLPNWLDSHNKTIFGTLFVVNELIVLWCWLKGKRPTNTPVRRGVSVFKWLNERITESFGIQAAHASGSSAASGGVCEPRSIPINRRLLKRSQ